MDENVGENKDELYVKFKKNQDFFGVSACLKWSKVKIKFISSTVGKKNQY
jgi:predicted transport protein